MATSPLYPTPARWQGKRHSSPCSPLESTGPNSTVFVKGIPEGMGEEGLEEAFARFGTIKPKGVTIMRKGGPASDFAFVRFEEVAAMHAAVEASVLLNGNKVGPCMCTCPLPGKGGGVLR